jgi:hypothetical protein
VVTQVDVRRVVHTLPHVVERDDCFGFDIVIGAKKLGFVWLWRERVDPKKARVPNPDVLALRVPDLDAKEALLMSDHGLFFTEPHYDGYAAVLVRLTSLTGAELRVLLKNAHAALVEKITRKKARAGTIDRGRVKERTVRNRR